MTDWLSCREFSSIQMPYIPSGRQSVFITPANILSFLIDTLWYIVKPISPHHLKMCFEKWTIKLFPIMSFNMYLNRRCHSVVNNHWDIVSLNSFFYEDLAGRRGRTNKATAAPDKKSGMCRISINEVDKGLWASRVFGKRHLNH
jgi:hypothetical protein